MPHCATKRDVKCVFFVGDISCEYWLASGSNESIIHVHDIGVALQKGVWCSIYISFIYIQPPSTVLSSMRSRNT